MVIRPPLQRLNIVGILLLAVLLALQSVPVSAVAQGDGMMLYGEGTVTTPRYRQWTQQTATWGNETTGIAAAATIRHTVSKAAPTRDEALVGIQTTGGTLYIQRWNGSSWTNEWNIAVGNGNLPRFDIAYENNSGDAIVVYSRNVGTTNELQYRRWNGASWTAATNLDAVRTSGVVHAVQLQAASSGDDIALAWGDANLDLSANYWVGATNTWAGEPAAALSTSLAVVGTATALTNWSFDVAIESVSGDVLVVWGNNAVLDLQYATRGSGAGGSWGSPTTNTAAFEEPTDLELSSDPNSDYIAYANATESGALNADASTWTGTAWNTFNNFDTSIDTVAAGTNNIAVGWVASGAQSRAIVTYDDANAAGVDWVVYNKNTNTWAVQADFTTAPAPVGVDDKLQRIRTNPHNSEELMLIVVDNNSDLFAKQLVFDGSTLTWTSSEPGGVAIETTISSITGAAADFAYWRYLPPPSGSLMVDIVDGSGVSVGTPSLNMTGMVASNSCQTSNGIVGVPTQNIRVNNTTIAPAWTLTLAATNGVTAAWSSGTDTYDFNDPAGAVSGCSDGGDADSVAGVLRVDPGGMNVTPQNGCTTNGLSPGSQGTFSQAVTDSITLVTASASTETNCYWDIGGIDLTQKIPSFQAPGTYSLNMTLTVVAN